MISIDLRFKLRVREKTLNQVIGVIASITTLVLAVAKLIEAIA